MSKPPYRALRIVLRVLAFLFVLGGVVMILSTKSLVLRVFMTLPESQVSAFTLFLVKEMGGLFLMLSLLCYWAARDPLRNAAILNALIAGLCALTVTPLISFAMLDFRGIFPASLVWGRSATRLALAGVLYWLRPGTRTNSEVGHDS
jgi:hypothetical protein